MFVRRNGGDIQEAYTQPQPKYDDDGQVMRDERGVPLRDDTLEAIADDHPDVLAFQERPIKTAKTDVDVLREELRAKGVPVDAPVIKLTAADEFDVRN